MKTFYELTRECIEFLREKDETGNHPGHINDDRFKAWLKAVYAQPDPGFLFSGNYFACYEQCRGKDIQALNESDVRGCATYLLRALRHEYPPYRCLTSGELLACLERWLELEESV